MTSVYVASPYGFSEATKGFYAELLETLARFGPHDPWANTEDIGAANEAAIRRCDAVLAVLDGTDVDSGVAAEVGFAAALGKPVIGLRLDFRDVGDLPGTVVNLQVEHWLARPVARSVAAAVELLVEVLEDAARVER